MTDEFYMKLDNKREPPSIYMCLDDKDTTIMLATEHGYEGCTVWLTQEQAVQLTGELCVLIRKMAEKE